MIQIDRYDNDYNGQKYMVILEVTYSYVDYTRFIDESFTENIGIFTDTPSDFAHLSNLIAVKETSQLSDRELRSIEYLQSTY